MAKLYTPAERRALFWSKVDKRGPGECWPWTAAITAVGYGKAKWDGKDTTAHRLAWTLTHGPIPPGAGHHGTCVCHRCDFKLCCNPAHLFLGTIQDNIADMDAKGRRRYGGAEHLPRGEAHWKAKLTESAVTEIRTSTETHRALAIRFGVHRCTIKRVRRGDNWR